MAGRTVHLRRARPTDAAWLAAVGLDPEKIGSQYHLVEAPLQLVVAPARAFAAPRAPAAVIEVDGRRAGYVGPNPLSRNLEYFLQPWARGGTGTAAVTGYLRHFRAGDRARRFFVATSNERSMTVLLRACAAVGWQEGREVRIETARHGRWVWIPPGSPEED
ncbi:MAG: GNAT family N-acetyltransferase [Microthrixaceae bacterium]